METLVKPLRDGDKVLQQYFQELFNSTEVQLVPATRALWEDAAEIRAGLNLEPLTHCTRRQASNTNPICLHNLCVGGQVGQSLPDPVPVVNTRLLGPGPPGAGPLLTLHVRPP